MTAGSSDEDCVQRLMGHPEVQSGVGHMCRFGMVASKPASAGGSGLQLARKLTRWMSSSPEVLKH
eukprot:1617303-Alexandrium_andersonii.AAC.1